MFVWCTSTAHTVPHTEYFRLLWPKVLSYSYSKIYKNKTKFNAISKKTGKGGKEGKP